MESRKITQHKAAGQPQPFTEGDALQQLSEKVQHFRSDATTALTHLRSDTTSALSAVKHDYKRVRAAMHRLHDHSALLSFLHEKFPRPATQNAKTALRNRPGKSLPR
ncbi:MAG: hypothetical protein Q7T32_05260 [Moraxellaceae bacterium]|nr:hypothetical protein [Moraxellaceae bacterium]